LFVMVLFLLCLLALLQGCASRFTIVLKRLLESDN
jgi:hypothetical protein